MKRTFFTSKDREEIIAEIKYIKENYKKLYYSDVVVQPFRFIKGTKISIDGAGRNITYWRLDIDTPGEISIERCTTFADWLMILTFVVIDFILGFLFLYPGTDIGVGILFLLGFILVQFLFFYYGNFISPVKKFKKLVDKYLGGC